MKQSPIGLSRKPEICWCQCIRQERSQKKKKKKKSYTTNGLSKAKNTESYWLLARESDMQIKCPSSIQGGWDDWTACFFFFLFSFLKIKQIIVHYHFTYPNGNKFHWVNIHLKKRGSFELTLILWIQKETTWESLENLIILPFISQFYNVRSEENF